MNNAWPPLPDVAGRLGLSGRGSRWGPCPACGATATGADRRPPLRLRKGWWCIACDARGDAISLVGLVLHKEARPRGRLFMRCKDWLDGSDELQGQASPVEPPRRIDPAPALRRAVSLRQAHDPDLTAWLHRRKIPVWANAGWLPDFEAEWWPKGWSRAWPILVPACSSRGVVESFQGLAVRDSVQVGKMWPKGAEARELLFADRGTRSWLQGRAPPPKRLLVVEGAPDYLTANAVIKDMTVIGIAAGGAPALRLVTLPPDIELYVGTHQDATGRDYAKAVVAAFEPRLVTPLPLWRLFA